MGARFDNWRKLANLLNCQFKGIKVLKKNFVMVLIWSTLLGACQSNVNIQTNRGQFQETSFPPAPTLSPAGIDLGQQVYADNCASCHGAKLEGEADWKTQNGDGSFRAPPHDASGHTWHHGDELLIEAINLGGARLPDNIGGTSNMPAFGDVLTEEEMMAALTYIKSNWSEEFLQLQWEATVREQERTNK